MIDVALAIDAEARDVTYKGVAAANGTWVNGYWVENAPATPTIRAVVQPATGRQLMDLPEGIRSEGKFIIWSRTAFVENDEFAFDGDNWRVIYLMPRRGDGFTRGVLGKLA